MPGSTHVETACETLAAPHWVQVVRSQAKGLETEYDRLLGEHEELSRRLKRADPTYGGGGGGSGGGSTRPAADDDFGFGGGTSGGSGGGMRQRSRA